MTGGRAAAVVLGLVALPAEAGGAVAGAATQVVSVLGTNSTLLISQPALTGELTMTVEMLVLRKFSFLG